MHVQVRINRKVKMKSTKTQCYVAEKKFWESGTSRAISTVAILLCLSFLVSIVLQFWSVCSSKRKGLQETKQELLFHSNQDQFVRGCLRGRCLGTLKYPISMQALYLFLQNFVLGIKGTTKLPTCVLTVT